MNDVLCNKMYQSGVIAVLVIDEVKDAVPLARALLEGDVDIMELTLRTPVAMDALEEIKNNVPEMMVGIGTVLTPDQVRQVSRLGAAFSVAPGLNPNVVKAAQKEGLAFSPGIVTPSDIECAVELGCNVLKYFPAEPAGGLAYLKSMTNPYTHLGLKYIPLGGLNQDNFKTYLEFPPVLAVGGSWIAKRDTIKKNDWKTITDNARQASKVVKNLRGS
ncbi:MAG: bifunctional 4-hydroxy-2-oxoglutarate aldolase/2-dehydro-3-deoxy-phosphogluconate aldolase [Phycisphaerales bacterium]|nr:MAG: bifunctional 4-hydroxy-2-oxoglutarate aldolase/2-dehydro-3-deoxy-phosphogluconate aldolase [Phycisphaerales bacterium]